MGIRIPRVTRDAAQRVSRIAAPACGLVRNDRFLGSAMSIGGGGGKIGFTHFECMECLGMILNFFVYFQ